MILLAGGDIIKDFKKWILSFLESLFKSLHKEKTAQSIKIEAVEKQRKFNVIGIFKNTK